MARRRHFIARPHDHLAQAAAVHGRLATGELTATGADAEGDGEAIKQKGRGHADRVRDPGTGRFK